MKNARNLFYLLLLFSVLWMSGCAVPRPHIPPNAANPIRTVAVLPMLNNTNDVEAPETVRTMFAERLKEWHYTVKPLNEVNQTIKDELGITLGSQLDQTNPKELGDKLGVDAVIYGTLFNFEEKITGVLNIRRARAGFKLVDTKTGTTVWGRGQGVKSETRMTEGVAGAVAGVASGVGRAQDKSEGKEMKDAGDYIGVQEWHNLPPEKNIGEEKGGIIGAFAAGLAEKTIKKATGTFLKKESEMMIEMIFRHIPAGPGSGPQMASVPPQSQPVYPMPPALSAPGISIPAFFEFGKRDFAADMITTSVVKSNNETMTFDAKIAKLGEMFRSEMDMAKALRTRRQEAPPGFGRMIVIARHDLKLDYQLYPDKNKYLEMPVREGRGERPEIEKHNIGVEKIDGHPCDKYHVNIIFKDGHREEGLLWEAKDLDGFVIRAEMENKDAKTVIEMKNVKLISPPATLFDVPQGYVKAGSMMEIMMEEKH